VLDGIGFLRARDELLLAFAAVASATEYLCVDAVLINGPGISCYDLLV